MKKKFFVILTVIAMCFAFTACGDSGTSKEDKPEIDPDVAIGRKELEGRQLLYCSDAHRLADMSIGDNYIDLPVKSERPDAADVVKCIKDMIHSGKEQSR